METNMTNQDKQECCEPKGKNAHVNTGASGAVYGLGMIGAAIYFIGTAGSFWAGVLGFLKAIIWPVFLVLKAFQSLG